MKYPRQKLMQKLIKDYLSLRTMAVVGASNARGKFGNLACRELKERCFRIFPVNPHEKEICGEQCYRSISEVPGTVDRILIIQLPEKTEQLVKELDPLAIAYVWMQNGAESREAILICRPKGIKAIHCQCILMHAQPVRSYHRLHRWWDISLRFIFKQHGGYCHAR